MTDISLKATIMQEKMVFNNNGNSFGRGAEIKLCGYRSNGKLITMHFECTSSISFKATLRNIKNNNTYELSKVGNSLYLYTQQLRKSLDDVEILTIE